MSTSFQLDRFFGACTQSGKEPVTIAAHSAGPVEEIPELTMDLNALSKLMSVSERQSEPKSSNADSDEGFEATYLKDEVDEQYNAHLLDSSLADSDQTDRPLGKNFTSGPGLDDDDQAVTDAVSKTPLRTAVGSASDSVLSDGQSAAPHPLASGPQSETVTKSGETNEGAEVTNQIRGHVRTGVEQTANGPQSTKGTSGAPKKTDAGAAPLGIELSAVGAPSTPGLTKAAATVDKVNVEGLAKTSPSARGQPLGGTALAEFQTEAGDLNTNQKLAKNPNSTASMTLLERHLGGYSVRLLPDTSQAATTAREMKANGLNHTKAGSTAALQKNGLTDLEKMQATQRLVATQPNADLLSGTTQGDIPQEAVWDVRPGTHPNSVAASTSIAARPELAASVSHQIAEAMRVTLDRSVEIALNPTELGRVRMVLSPSDAGVTLNILAERPETLDLMRRNIDDLAKSFADIGYEDISFSFEQNDNTADDDLEQSGDAHDSTSDGSDVPSASAIPLIPKSQLAIAPDGVDMRL